MMARRRRSKAKQSSSVQNATLRNPVDAWLADAIMLPQASSGERVGPRDMLGYPPAWNCINRICGHVGYLPLNLYERDQADDRKKKLAERLAAYWLLKHQPNPMMSPMVLRQTLQAHALWDGNGRAYIQRNARGEPSGLWPLPPNRVQTMLIESDGEEGEIADVVEGKVVEKWHLLRDDEGTLIPIPDRNVLHIAGLGYDGVQGYSVIDLAREWLGLAKAQNKAVGKNFSTGARPSFMLHAPPGPLFKTPEDARKWLADFRAQHEGVDNEGKVGLLTGGIEAKVLQISARDSQWQEQRIFSRQDAGLWFCVEQMLGDDSSVSYNSLEQKNQAYYTNCLMRWLTTWEQECWGKLLTQQQQLSMRFYFRFVVAALLRGTTLERYTVYEKARAMRVMSANDVREAEDMDPVEGGDEYDNPNIDTKADAQEDATAETSTSGDTSALQTKLRHVVASRLREIQQVEANRVKQAASKEANFCEWVDGFYTTSSFGGRIETTFDAVGLSSLTADEYCRDSKTALLDAAGSSTPDTLAANVAQLVSSWTGRIDQLAALAVGVT